MMAKKIIMTFIVMGIVVNTLLGCGGGISTVQAASSVNGMADIPSVNLTRIGTAEDKAWGGLFTPTQYKFCNTAIGEWGSYYFQGISFGNNGGYNPAADANKVGAINVFNKSDNTRAARWLFSELGFEGTYVLAGIYVTDQYIYLIVENLGATLAADKKTRLLIYQNNLSTSFDVPTRVVTAASDNINTINPDGYTGGSATASPANVTKIGNYLLVARPNQTTGTFLSIIDVSDPTQLDANCSTPTTTIKHLAKADFKYDGTNAVDSIYDITYSGAYAYVSTGITNGTNKDYYMFILNMSNPMSPTVESSINVGYSTPVARAALGDIKVEGNFAYIAEKIKLSTTTTSNPTTANVQESDLNYLYVVNISNPVAPSFVAKHHISPTLSSSTAFRSPTNAFIEVAGNFIIWGMMETNNGAIEIIELSSDKTTISSKKVLTNTATGTIYDKFYNTTPSITWPKVNVTTYTESQAMANPISAKFNGKVYFAYFMAFASNSNVGGTGIISLGNYKDVTVDYYPKSVQLPYTIQGSCTNSDTVELTINGTPEDVSVTNGRWSRVISSVGDYNVTVKAKISGVVNDATAENMVFSAKPMDAVVTIPTLAFGAMNIGISMINNGATAKNVTPIIAVYKNNRLVEATVGALQSATVGTVDLTDMTINIANDPDGINPYTLKVFVWDNIYSMVPIVDATQRP